MKSRALALTFVGLFALVLCQQANGAGKSLPARRSTTNVDPLSLPPKLTGLDACGTRRMVVRTVARILIPANLSDMTRQRLVKYAPATVIGDDETIYSNQSTLLEDATAKDIAFARNPFHLATSSVRPSIKDETYLEVRVILQNKDLKFLDSAGLRRPIKGVAYEDGKPGAVWLCQRDEPFSPERTIVTFFVERRSAGNPVEASINLLIGAINPNDSDWGKETPILIDPKIKNDG